MNEQINHCSTKSVLVNESSQLTSSIKCATIFVIFYHFGCFRLSLSGPIRGPQPPILFSFSSAALEEGS